METAENLCLGSGCWVKRAILQRSQAVIKKKIMPDSLVYTDSLGNCDKLNVSSFIHHYVNHSKAFADRQNHIDGIENFWNQTRRYLRKFNGIPKEHFELYLKEYELCFNNSEIKVQISILKQLGKNNLSQLSRVAPNI